MPVDSEIIYFYNFLPIAILESVAFLFEQGDATSGNKGCGTEIAVLGCIKNPFSYLVRPELGTFWYRTTVIKFC